jgi:hypothetical protein
MNNEDDNDEDNDYLSFNYGFGGLLGSIFGGGLTKEMTPAGRMLARLDRADAAIKTQEHIGHDVQAALRRCQIRSQWPTWDHKA